MTTVELGEHDGLSGGAIRPRRSSAKPIPDLEPILELSLRCQTTPC